MNALLLRWYDLEFKLNCICCVFLVHLLKACKMKHFVRLFTWEQRYKLIEELHAFVATLSLRTATLFQKP